MQTQDALIQALKTVRPVAWDQLPDLNLYKDQVLSYMQRQVLSFDEEDALTSAMINNYIKAGLLPRAEGKKYSRQHIACLTAACVLKQVLSVGNAERLMHEETRQGIEPFYGKYLSVLDEALASTAKTLEQAPEDSLSDLALRLAISSYAQRLACMELLKRLTPDAPEPRHGK